VPVGTAGPDTVDFGLRTNPATATDPVHWVHITDTQIKTWGQGHLDDDLLEINELAVPPSFLINTGDIVQVGSDSTHWNNYVSQLAASDFPVLHVVGTTRWARRPRWRTTNCTWARRITPSRSEAGT
jgi:hypothetical protein